jgi:hypothetical protein
MPPFHLFDFRKAEKNPLGLRRCENVFACACVAERTYRAVRRSKSHEAEMFVKERVEGGQIPHALVKVAPSHAEWSYATEALAKIPAWPARRPNKFVNQ